MKKHGEHELHEKLLSPLYSKGTKDMHTDDIVGKPEGPKGGEHPHNPLDIAGVKESGAEYGHD